MTLCVVKMENCCGVPRSE